MMSSMSSDDTLSRSCLLKISTGTAVSATVLPWRRVPRTTTSSSISAVSCCAIALQCESAATTNMLVVRTNRAVGGFLLIATRPCPCQLSLLTITFITQRALQNAFFTEYRKDIALFPTITGQACKLGPNRTRYDSTDELLIRHPRGVGRALEAPGLDSFKPETSNYRYLQVAPAFIDWR